MGTFFRGYNFVSHHDFHWFFILISNIMFTVLLRENVKSLYAAHASSLLVTHCRALAARLWFLVVMYCQPIKVYMYSQIIRLGLIVKAIIWIWLFFFIATFPMYLLYIRVVYISSFNFSVVLIERICIFLWLYHFKNFVLSLIKHWELIVFLHTSILLTISIFSLVTPNDPRQKENCYRAASSRWWGDSAVAGPGWGSPQWVNIGRDLPAVDGRRTKLPSMGKMEHMTWPL